MSREEDEDLGLAERVDEALERLRGGEAAGLSELVGASVPTPLLGLRGLAPPPSEPPPPAGVQVGRYRLLRELGRGGMGVVYEAEQEGLARTVALKFIRSGRLADEAEIRLLQREARALSKLLHPAIVRVLEAGVSDGCHYVAMERAEGVPLTGWLAKAPRSLHERLDLFAALCAALHHAHVRGVIHRDLKPANVLVDETGAPHVLDFGLARLVEGEECGEPSATLAGRFAGTLPWMSPEQVKGGDVDVRSDVYSLGLLLYRMLTGAAPYEVPSGSPLEGARVIAEQPPRRPRELDPTLPLDLEAIVLKALEKNPARRYAGAGDLAADVERFRRREPVTARVPSPIYRAALFARRRRGLVAAVAAMLVLAVASFAAVLAGLQAARDEARRTASVLQLLVDSWSQIDPRRAGGPNTAARELLAVFVRLVEGTSDLEIEARLQLTLGNAFVKYGLFAEADPHLVRALEIQRRLHTSDHEDLARAIRSLGFLRHAQERHEDALPLKREAVEMRLRLFGDAAHPDVLQSREELADLFLTQGNVEDAIGLYRRNVETLERAAGASPERRAEVLLVLAEAVDVAGRPAESLELKERALTCVEQASSVDPLVRARVVNRVVRHWVWVERFAQADALVRAALEELGPGDSHPLARSTLLDALATLEGLQDRPDPALTLRREQRRLLTLALGEDHLEVIDVLQAEARLLADSGRQEEAETLLQYASVRLARRSGSEHSHAASLLGTQAVCAIAAGQLERAEELLNDALERCGEDGKPAERVLLLAQSHALALAANDPARAKAAAERAFHEAATRLGERHSLTQQMLVRCGSASLDVGRFAEALERFEQVDDLAGYLGESLREDGIALHLGKARAHEALGRPAEARRLLERLLLLLPQEHPEGANIRRRLAALPLGE